MSDSDDDGMSDGDEVYNHNTDPNEANSYSCYNVWAGTEANDDCGVCSGGSTGLTPDADKDECGVCFGSGAGANQYVSNGSCIDITTSLDGYYISTPATSSSDNLFSECTVCADGYFVSTECTDVSDTVCDAIICGTDEYVSSNTCVACPAGTTNASDDDASSSDTVCDATLCAADEYVSSNQCLPCAAGYENSSDDDASSYDTVCD